jgi:hypothetical protein
LVSSYDDVPPYPSATRPAIRPSSASDAWRLCHLESFVGWPGGILRDDGQARYSRRDSPHDHVNVDHHDDDVARHFNVDHHDHTFVAADDNKFLTDDDHHKAAGDDHDHRARHHDDDRAHLLHVALGRSGVQLR